MNNETFIFTVSVNCSKITAIMLKSFIEQHPGRHIHVIGTKMDLEELQSYDAYFDKHIAPFMTFLDISDEHEALDKFTRGHAGSAHVFAMVLSGRFGEFKYVCHIDSDVYFKKESISLIEDAFDAGYGLVGPRRCYGNNPSGIAGLNEFPDTIATYFMGVNMQYMPKYDFDKLCKYCEGAWHPLNWPLLDFFDGVSHAIMNSGGKVLHLDWNMVGSQNTEGKKNNDYVSNLHFDCGSHLVHFGGVGSGYAYSKGRSNPEMSYAKWALGRWSLFSKYFYGVAIENVSETVYGSDGRWVNGDYDENIMKALEHDCKPAYEAIDINPENIIDLGKTEHYEKEVELEGLFSEVEWDTEVVPDNLGFEKYIGKSQEMSAENFAYWLQGFMELANPSELNSDQVQIIKDHLSLVFSKHTPCRAEKVPRKNTGPIVLETDGTKKEKLNC